MVAVVLASGFAVLFLPGMPAALVWPYEWVIFGGWAVAGAVLITRVAHVGPGPRSHDRMAEAAARRGMPADQGEPR